MQSDARSLPISYNQGLTKCKFPRKA